MSFSKGLRKNINNSLENVNKEVMQTIELFGKSLVDYSPKFPDARYAQGVFINSWYPAVNEFDPTIGSAENMEGMDSLRRLKGVISSKAFVRQDAFISFSNNLSYSRNVEYLGWRNTLPYAPISNSITFVLGANKL